MKHYSFPNERRHIDYYSLRCVLCPSPSDLSLKCSVGAHQYIIRGQRLFKDASSWLEVMIMDFYFVAFLFVGHVWW